MYVAVRTQQMGNSLERLPRLTAVGPTMVDPVKPMVSMVKTMVDQVTSGGVRYDCVRYELHPTYILLTSYLHPTYILLTSYSHPTHILLTSYRSRGTSCRTCPGRHRYQTALSSSQRACPTGRVRMRLISIDEFLGELLGEFFFGVLTSSLSILATPLFSLAPYLDVCVHAFGGK